MTAREVAFTILKEWKPKAGAYATERLDGLLKNKLVAPQDRRLATELTFGVIRRQATLDAVLKPHVSRPKSNVEPDLWTLLRLGCYQLTFLSGMADHAAVHETVELAKQSNVRWSGFANAVLRRVSAGLTNAVLNTPTADGIPLADGRFRLSASKIFADPDEEFGEYFAEAFSFPLWLTKRWESRFDQEELLSLGKHFNAPPALTLRVNILKTTRDDYLAQLKTAGLSAKAGTHSQAVRLLEAVRVEELPGFAEGLFSVQDETAMQAGTLLAPAGRMRVLDLCAAPGTKTTHLAEIMGDSGEILAVDTNALRLGRVAENAARLSLRSICPRVINDDGSGLPTEDFDAILIDAPCSNTGVLAKRPEARWRITPVDLRELSTLQTRLLTMALNHVRPGGKVLYSTCSIEPEENEAVVQTALAGRHQFSVIDTRLYMPGTMGDGGFQTLIARDEQ